jgi:5-formyltetrahydrofolate cyclo-ligase
MKKIIREKLKERRKSLSEIDRERKSHKAYEKLIALEEMKNAKKVLVYISTGEELVTHFMVRRFLEMDMTVYVPKTEPDSIIACRLDHWDDLEFGYQDILEPKEVIEIIHPKEIDLILVPAVAFTKKGERIGMGSGYYDRFLARTDAFKVGLAYEDQIIDEIPVEDHDIHMDIVITDENIYKN